MDHPLQLWFVHPDAHMIAAVRTRFASLPNVQFHQKNFEDLPPHDCFVTAGNAYGIMSAGIDSAVVRFFGPQIMLAVQAHIRHHYLGEQPLGTAFILPTSHPHVKFLAHAPTMRTPTSIDGTDKIYAATWAALLAVHAHNSAAAEKIQTVAFPAFGTGFGQTPYGEAARQMAAAYTHYLDPPTHLDWDTVIARQKAICYDQGKRMVHNS